MSADFMIEIDDVKLPLEKMRAMSSREARLAYAIRYAFSVGRLTCLHSHAAPDDVCAGCVATAALGVLTKGERA